MISRADLADLLEYSTTDPTGVYIGKRWRADVLATRRLAANIPEHPQHKQLQKYKDAEPEWVIREYVEHPDDPHMAGIRETWAIDENGQVHRGKLGPGKLV